MASGPKARLWLWQCSKCNYKSGCRWWKKLHCFQVYRSSSCFSVSSRCPPPSKPLIPSVSPYSLSFPQHTAVICTGKLSGFSSSGSELPQTSSAEAVVIGTWSYYSQGQICALIVSGNSKTPEGICDTGADLFSFCFATKDQATVYSQTKVTTTQKQNRSIGSELDDDLNCNSILYKISLSPEADATLEKLSQFLCAWQMVCHQNVWGKSCPATEGMSHVNWNWYLYGYIGKYKTSSTCWFCWVLLHSGAKSCIMEFHALGFISYSQLAFCVKVQFLPNKSPKFHACNYFAITYFHQSSTPDNGRRRWCLPGFFLAFTAGHQTDGLFLACKLGKIHTLLGYQ